jgi:BirA family transcriptional regulator, biotin operon repressor / biotin---[acetyl-CoA-carboxylase] ligase
MDQTSLEAVLADLHLPAIRFFNSIDSTNSEAWRWFEEGAPHAALVVANAQTAGRGRSQRRWMTVAGGGLAFSLILRSPPLDKSHFSRLVGLGALAISQALRKQYTLPAMIKWPNDILLDQRKTGGVLVEARWSGEDLCAVVIGIGINIAPISINSDDLPPSILNFPATCIEQVLGHPVERMELLGGILKEFFSWLPRLHLYELIKTWEENLAYRGQWVELWRGADDLIAPNAAESSNKLIGKIIGLESEGSLQVSDQSGKVFSIQAGEIHLRPASLLKLD